MDLMTNVNEMKWVDVMGSNIQTKHIKHGVGETAEMGTIVSCNLTGYFGDDIDHLRPFENLRNQVFEIGEMDTLPSIELSLRHSRAGDFYWLRSSFKFAFGLVGRPGVPRGIVANPVAIAGQASPLVAIPPNADLEYYIEVIGHYETAAAAAAGTTSSSELESRLELEVKSEISNENENEKENERNLINKQILDTLAASELRRVCGNRWFSYGDYPKAKKSYAKGVEIAQNYLSNEPENENETTDLVDKNLEIENIREKTIIPGEVSGSKGLLMVSLISCLGNLAACHLSMKEYIKTKEICVRVLELEPDNIKALIRAAKASLALHEYDECALCLENVREIAPSDPSLVLELGRLKSARSAYSAKEKQIAKNIASKLFK